MGWDEMSVVSFGVGWSCNDCSYISWDKMVQALAFSLLLFSKPTYILDPEGS